MTKRHLSARQRRLGQPLDADRMYAIARRLLPRRNDYSTLQPWDELVQEVGRFGITTRGDFTRLMKRHRRSLIAEDREPQSADDLAYFANRYGDALLRDQLRRQYWYALQAMVRTAMKLEFGDAAVVYEDAEEEPPQTAA